MKFWNEEFIACNNSLYQEKNLLGKINKIKLCRRSQFKFLQNCKSLVEGITNKEMIPMNMGLGDPEYYYLQNNTLISVAKNNSDNWRVPQKDFEMTSYSAANCDLRNLSDVLKMGLKGVNLINMALVDRLGNRYVLQNLLEGMLHFDPKKWARHGTFDEGKVYYKDPKFDKATEQICDQFWLSKNNHYEGIDGNKLVIDEEDDLSPFLDKNILEEIKNKQISGLKKEIIGINGSPEVKGIIAGDGRKYLMELLRISPRDLNFDDQQEHQSCVIRSELIKNYQIMKSLNKMYKSQMNKDQNPESKLETQNSLTESEDPNKIEKLELNPTLFTYFPSIGPNTEKQIIDLKKIASHLKNEALPAVVAELSELRSPQPVIDCISLVEILHKNGVNTRYLGHLYEMMDKNPHLYMKKLVEFCIMVRSFVNMCRDEIKRYENENSIEIILHCLNLLLAEREISEEIENRYKIYHDISNSSKTQDLDNNQSENKDLQKPSQIKIESEEKEKEKSNEKSNKNETTNRNIKKRKRRRKQKNKKKEKILQPGSETFKGPWFKLVKPELYQDHSSKTKKFISFKSLTLDKIISKMQNIAFKKYSFKKEISLDIFKEYNQKIRFIREVLVKMGLSLCSKTISFSTKNKAKGNYRAPLKTEDIAKVGIKIKAVDHILEEIQLSIFTADKILKLREFDKALTSLGTYLPLALNIYGIFHNDVIRILNKMGICYAFKNEMKKAVQYQIISYVISLRLNGPQDQLTLYILKCLGNYLYEIGRIETSFRVHKFSLKSLDILGGKLNPLSIECLSQLHTLSVALKNINLSELILEELERRTSALYGKGDERNLNWLSRLAYTKCQKGQFETAKKLQTRHSFILRQLIRKLEEANIQAKKGEVKTKEIQSANKKMTYIEYYRMNLQKKFEESEKMKKFFKKKEHEFELKNIKVKSN